MQVLLDSDSEKFVRDKVASGAYSCANEVIRQALQVLRERDNAPWSQSGRETKDIGIGVEQASRGQMITLDEAVVGEIKEQSARRFRMLRGR